MTLLALGVDYRSAPTSVREALAFDGPKLAAGLASLHREFPSIEHVVLSTCNRVELYAASPASVESLDPTALAAWLARFQGVESSLVARHLAALHDEAAVSHLFRVASSIESLVVGEGQILGQVREAYRAAIDADCVGPITHALFQRALRVGKDVRDATGLGRGRLSIASVAVEVAQSVFDSFGDKVVLVIGAGKMSDLTLQHLSALRPGRIVICNRNPDRAKESAERWRAEAVPFDRLDDALIEADLVVSTTAAEQPIVTYERYAALQRKPRGGRLALILDIAVPRDFDPRVGDLDQVLLYNVDDLRGQVEQNLKRRRSQMEPALAVIDRHAAEFIAELRHERETGALLRQLGEYGDDVARKELEKFFATCPNLDQSQREAAEHLVHRLKNQFLHHPRSALRSAVKHETGPHPIIAAVCHIFGLRAPGEPAKEDGHRHHTSRTDT